jgi:hypothetical protein
MMADEPMARTSPPSLDSVGQALDDYTAAMAEKRRQGLTRDLTGEAVGQILRLGFAIEQLRRNLVGLADRVRE